MGCLSRSRSTICWAARSSTWIPLAVREECRKYAQKFLDLQRSQFKRLGVLGRWEQPYSTMDPQYESVVLETFYSCYEQGLVYKGLKSVYWCIHDKTALAEAEVEYEMHTSPSIWVRYALTSDPGKIDPALAGKKMSPPSSGPRRPGRCLRRWRSPSHPTPSMSRSTAANGSTSSPKSWRSRRSRSALWANTKELALFPGAKLEHATFAHPFLDRQVLGVLGDYVTMDTGTGAVHTAPAHGADDFNTGVKYGLDLHCDVDDGGILRNGLPEYEGQQVFKANPLIVELLKSRGVLLGLRKNRALVSALLALSQPHHLSRHRAVVHLHGRQTSFVRRCMERHRVRRTR